MWNYVYLDERKTEEIDIEGHSMTKCTALHAPPLPNQAYICYPKETEECYIYTQDEIDGIELIATNVEA